MTLSSVFVVLAIGCIALVGLVGGVALMMLIASSLSREGKMGINLEAVHCPRCEKPMSGVRVPKNLRQTMWGGWTCPDCGCEMDKWGKPVGGGAG